ncbi:MAG: aldehyde dehydrogenase [Candidatus Puniceispirillaceae bacterium]
MADITNYDMLINGQWVQASDGATFSSVDPANGAVWATIPAATGQDVDHAVEAAAAALNGPWGRMTPSERGKCLGRLADLLADHSEQIGRIETKDTGKMLKETKWQCTYIAEYLRYYAGAADKLHGDTLPIDKPDMFVFTKREPLGVIAAVIPWNSQMFLSAVKIGPALATGNCMVLKASEHASAPLLEFGKLVKQAGIPDGVINIITGFGDPCGKRLTSHPKVARIAFTGGATAARHVIHNSAENFADVSLELGGKSPFIVFDDANIESAVNGCIAGIFGASGQSCVAGSRLYLHDAIADDFLDQMIAMAEKIRLGDPQADETQMGPLCTQEQMDHITSQIAQAVTEGGTVLTGGNSRPDLGPRFFEPTIISCPSQDMMIVQTELFGPVLAVQRFTSEDEVLALANASDYGLAAGIFTTNHARALRLSSAINAGIVWVNTYRAISPIAEFGGVKQSGHGREAGFQAMLDYTKPKTVWMTLSDDPLSNPFQMR